MCHFLRLHYDNQLKKLPGLKQKTLDLVTIYLVYVQGADILNLTIGHKVLRLIGGCNKNTYPKQPKHTPADISS